MLQDVTGSYKGLQRVQGVTKGYKRLQGVTRCVLYRVRLGYKGLFRVIKG